MPIFPSLTLLGGAENVGYMTSAMNLANIVEDQAEVTEQEYTYLNMAAMYILARVSASQCMGMRVLQRHRPHDQRACRAIVREDSGK